ncbi:MAG: hypothetical protein WC823_03860 [Parcubacteria group bacterium]
MPKINQFDGVIKMFFSSQGRPLKNGYPDDCKVIGIQIAPEGRLTCEFEALIIDPDFINKTRQFTGEVEVLYSSSNAVRMDMCALGLVQVLFGFPREENGRKECLAAYIDGGMLPVIREYFNC